jgi:hypothetical protein
MLPWIILNSSKQKKNEKKEAKKLPDENTRISILDEVSLGVAKMRQQQKKKKEIIVCGV